MAVQVFSRKCSMKIVGVEYVGKAQSSRVCIYLAFISVVKIDEIHRTI
jgi:hypothetical protein